MSVIGRSLSTIRVHCFADLPDGRQLMMEVLLFRPPLNGPSLAPKSILPERDGDTRNKWNPLDRLRRMARRKIS